MSDFLASTLSERRVFRRDPGAEFEARFEGRAVCGFPALAAIPALIASGASAAGSAISGAAASVLGAGAGAGAGAAGAGAAGEVLGTAGAGLAGAGGAAAGGAAAGSAAASQALMAAATLGAAGLPLLMRPKVPRPLPVVNPADTANRQNMAMARALQAGGSNADSTYDPGAMNTMAPTSQNRMPTLTGNN